jgi:hypothetical protein
MAEEEQACGVNLDGGRAGGMDLDGGGGATSRRMRRRTGWQGANIEAVGTASRQTRRRSDRRRVCDAEMIGLWFRGPGTLKKKDSSDRRG